LKKINNLKMANLEIIDTLLKRDDAPSFIAALLNSWKDQFFIVSRSTGLPTVCINASPTKAGGHAQLSVPVAVSGLYVEAANLIGKKVLVHVFWAIAVQMTSTGDLTRGDVTFTVTGQGYIPITSVGNGDFSHKLAPSRPSDNQFILAAVKAGNPQLHFTEKQWSDLESIECHGTSGQELPWRNQARKICSLRGRPDDAVVAAGLPCRCFLATDGPACEFW